MIMHLIGLLDSCIQMIRPAMDACVTAKLVPGSDLGLMLGSENRLQDFGPISRLWMSLAVRRLAVMLSFVVSSKRLNAEKVHQGCQGALKLQ